MNFPGEQPRWGLIHVLLIPLFVMGLQLLYITLGLDLFSYLVRTAGLPPTKVSEFVLDYLLYFFYFATGIGLVLLATSSRLERVGFKRQDLRLILKWGVGGGLILFVMVLGAGVIIQLLQPSLPPQPFEEVLRKVVTGKELLLMILVGSVLAPLVEEVYFRGMVYPVLRQYVGVIWGLIISGILFGLMHWDLWRTVPLALGGMVLAYIYERSRTIYAPWIAHGVWNGIMAVIVYLGQGMV
ncbi:MAG: CPBP family intramembrane metalloprotease [Syntrophomonadaceae bacterium]|nr:CPBP family intramembrane metalloprotease [Syntrophomonadaceae bacterium]